MKTTFLPLGFWPDYCKHSSSKVPHLGISGENEKRETLSKELSREALKGSCTLVCKTLLRIWASAFN